MRARVMFVLPLDLPNYDDKEEALKEVLMGMQDVPLKDLFKDMTVTAIDKVEPWETDDHWDTDDKEEPWKWGAS